MSLLREISYTVLQIKLELSQFFSGGEVIIHRKICFTSAKYIQSGKVWQLSAYFMTEVA